MKKFSIFRKKDGKRDKDLLIAATVIAAMAYQAAISPPGGVAGKDAEMNLAPGAADASLYKLEPGASLLAYFYTDLSNVFWISNTISLMSALSVIFLYVSGTSLKRKILIWLIRLAMWITLSSMVVAYCCAVIATTPVNTSFDDIDHTFQTLIIGVIAWAALLSLSLFVLLFHVIRCIVRRIKKKKTSQLQLQLQVEVAPPDNDDIV